jgi:tetratricopeptide (TPR) repeat protein
MSAPTRGRPKWLSKIFPVLQWLILPGVSVYLSVSLFSQTGATPTTIAVTLALISYIGYLIWRRIPARRAVAWNNKGFELLKLKRYEEAQESFNQALKLNPQFMSAWYGTGLCYMWLERYTEAVELFDRVLTFFPNNPYLRPAEQGQCAFQPIALA